MSKTTGVRAVILTGEDARISVLHEIPGAIFFSNNQVPSILHSCPCGCSKVGTINLDPSQKGRPLWKMTGDKNSPTLSPSVGIRPWGGEEVEPDGFHWHGWLKNGVWESV